VTNADTYNIDTYYREVHDDDRRSFPILSVRAGTAAPDFALPSIDGGTIALNDLLAKGHVVLIIGSFTAPPVLAQLPALETLSRTYGGRGFSFLFVYTREIHPGEVFPPHRTMEQKLEQARRMRDHARITFPIVADDLAGTTHRAYGNLPSFTYVIHKAGNVIYRSSWTQAERIRDVLDNVLLQEQAEAEGKGGRLAFSEWVSFMPQESREVWDLLDVAGPKARADYERELPKRPRVSF
jgi:hypothetical protein